MSDRFCPACAGTLATRDVEGAPRLVCARCGRVQYRNSKPTVGAILLDQRRVLLARRAREPRKGAWDLPGGFLEEGEDPVDGLRRELLEETNLTLSAAKLVDVSVSPYFDAFALCLSYVAVAEGHPRAADDVAELRWFSLDEELPQDIAFPHERRALERVAKGVLEPPSWHR